VAAGFQKWPQVFNLRNPAPDLLHVQVENLHPRRTKVAAGF